MNIPVSSQTHHPFPASIDSLPPGTPLIIVCRVSTPDQKSFGNLRDQKSHIREETRSRGLVAKGIRKRVHKGSESSWLKEVVDYARRKGVKVLVAETPDRFLRHPDWTPHRQDLQPSPQDWEQLKQITGDLILVTLLDPSSSSSEMRSQQTKRGQEQKGNKGGRPRRSNLSEEQQNLFDLMRQKLSQMEQTKES